MTDITDFWRSDYRKNVTIAYVYLLQKQTACEYLLFYPTRDFLSPKTEIIIIKKTISKYIDSVVFVIFQHKKQKATKNGGLSYFLPQQNQLSCYFERSKHWQLRWTKCSYSVLWHTLDQNSPLLQILERDWKVNNCKDLGKDITENEEEERVTRNGNEERGIGNGNGKWENEKRKQSREPAIKLLTVHEFNLLGFVLIFQWPVPYAHSPVRVFGFRIIPLKRSKQLRN